MFTVTLTQLSAQLSTWLRRWEAWLVVGLFAASLVIRLWHIETMMTFAYDQGRDLYVLQQITRGDVTLIGPTTGLPGVFLGPYFYYFLLPGFILGQGHPVLVLAWLMSWAVLTLPLVYWLLKPVIGRRLALLVYALAIVAEGSIDQARTIWNPSLVVITLLPAIGLLFASRRRSWLLPLSTLLFGLSLQTELAYTFFLMPAVVVWMGWYSPIGSWLKQWLTRQAQVARYDWLVILAAVIIGAATLLPQVIFELRNQFLISNSIVREFSDTSKKVPLAKVLQHRPAEMLAELDRTAFHHLPGTKYLVVAILLSSLWVFMVTRRAEARFWVAYAWLPLLGLLTQTGNYGHFFNYYLTAHYLPMLVCLGLVVHQVTVNLKRQPAGAQLGSIWSNVMTVGLALLAITILVTQAELFQPSNFQYRLGLQLEALQAARQVATHPETPLDVFVPNLVPVNYQYLSEWLSQSNQATPMPFGASGQPEEVILLWEKFSGDGPTVAHRDWRLKWQNYDCQVTDKYGILTLERCQLKSI
jgi:hypothetical protein